MKTLSLLLALLSVERVWSFSTYANVKSGARSPLFASSVTRSRQSSKPSLWPFLRYANSDDTASSPSSSAISAASAEMEVILREFEKKEARIQKQREAAMAKLTEYEESLKKLQSYKAEYLAATQLTKPPAGGSFSETAVRSAVMAFCWLLFAGCFTFITTLQYSHSLSVALQVVGADFFSKAFTMFIGERLMNRSKAGRTGGSDAVGRSLTKALIWRLFAICNTLTMAVFVAKDLSIASKIASTDAVFKTALMFFYERAWARIQWGKEYLLEYAI